MNETREGEVVNEDGSVTVPLLYPISDPSGTTTQTITLKRCKQKEMKALRAKFKDNEEFGEAFLAHSAGITLEDLGEMDMEDFAYLSERFSSVVGLGSKKGDATAASAG